MLPIRWLVGGVKTTPIRFCKITEGVGEFLRVSLLAFVVTCGWKQYGDGSFALNNSICMFNK